MKKYSIDLKSGQCGKGENMKVFKRVLIKLLLLLLVIGISGGGAACYQASRQSTADYAMDHYLALLIDNSVDKAYSSLDL